MTKIFENSGWVVVRDDPADQYCVTSPTLQTCVAKRVRVLSPLSFVIEHPVASSLIVECMQRNELPWVFVGNLEELKGKHIELLKKVVGIHLGGKMTRPHRKGTTIQQTSG